MNKDIQNAIRKGIKSVTIDIGSEKIELIRISPGEFLMGSPKDEKGHSLNEEPTRQVSISKAFYLGKYEVTQGQYQAIMNNHYEASNEKTLPISQISYKDAIKFCQKLSDTINLKIRLPKEVEWEYACRAGTDTPYYSGSTEEDLNLVGWFTKNSNRKIHPVGQKKPNSWGLYDMHGNVWEYCHDFIEDYQGMSNIDPVGQISSTYGAMRGGGWMHGAEYCRSASRLISDDMFGGGGFRILIEID